MPQIFVKDQNINLTEHERLNEFPSTILILNPGGCALFEFPIKMEQINMFIQSAKKPRLVSIKSSNSSDTDSLEFFLPKIKIIISILALSKILT